MTPRLAPRMLLLTALLLTAPAFALEPSTPAAKKFDVEAMIKLLPSDTKLRRGGKPNMPGMVQANQVLSEMAVGKTATITVKALSAAPMGNKLLVISLPQKVQAAGAQVEYVVNTYLASETLDPKLHILKNTRLIVVGKITRAVVETRENEPALTIDLDEAHVEEK